MIEPLGGDSQTRRRANAVARYAVAPALRRLRPGRMDPSLMRMARILEPLTGFLRLPLTRPAAGTHIQRIRVGACEAEWVSAPSASPVEAPRKAVMLYLHGGAFVVGGLNSHRRFVSQISAACAGMSVVSLAYRQLPESSINESVDDVVRAYRWLIEERGFAPHEVVFAGDSAGGYLAVASAIRLLSLGLPQPAGIVALSPWIDLPGLGRSEDRNSRLDPYMTAEVLEWAGAQHRRAFGALPTDLSDRSVPLTGLASLLIQVGSSELLLADARDLAYRANADGVPCRLQVFDGQMHVFQVLISGMPEARLAISEIAAFVDTCLSRPPTPDGAEPIRQPDR